MNTLSKPALLALSLAVSLLIAPATPALDALRSVPLAITSSAPATLTSADEVLGLLNNQRDVLFHMEIIRRSYQTLPPNQQGPLLVKLEKRYEAAPDDPVIFFDHGYAQLVFEQNKTGLFFLRKANDRIQDQFSAMAYAMAQAESDLRDEGASGENMTSRKVSVIHLMEDAARRNAERPKPGFWPSFVQMLDTLKPMEAYSTLTGTDFSVEAVPYGDLPSSSSAAPLNITNALASESGGGSVVDPYDAQNCSLTADPAFNPAQGVNTRKIDLTNNGFEETIQFVKNSNDTYDVMILDKNQLAMASFTSPVAPYIVEDLDGDDVYEIVIRQYRFDPLHPVRVYRYDGCQYVPDNDIHAIFE